MNNKDITEAFWQAMDQQAWDELPAFFHDNALISWPNTKECFSVNEFTAVNRNYPGDWAIRIDKILDCGDTIITVTALRNRNSSLAFHATSFFTYADNKIISLEEYWGEDGTPPDRELD